MKILLGLYEPLEQQPIWHFITGKYMSTLIKCCVNVVGIPGLNIPTNNVKDSSYYYLPMKSNKDSGLLKTFWKQNWQRLNIFRPKH